MMVKEISPQGSADACDGGIKELLVRLKQSSMETWDHSVRVSGYCRKIGPALELSRKELGRLSLFSLFHDIGKLEVDADILQKPEKLTSEEWKEMERHPAMGYRMALAIPELSEIADCILYHHERWDGLGYPKGLKGDQIPLLCRILAVADAFDAMTSDRVYRKALGCTEAVNELICNAGRQFDPRIVRAFIRLPAF